MSKAESVDQERRVKQEVRGTERKENLEKKKEEEEGGRIKIKEELKKLDSDNIQEGA